MTISVGPARRVLDFRTDGKTHLDDSLYAANYFRDGTTELIFAQGGHIYEKKSVDDPLGSDIRFGDRIWMSPRAADGSWLTPDLTVAKRLFPWMSNDEGWLAAHQETIVGCVASPSVYKIRDGRYGMALVATLNDPNACCGEHVGVSTYGSCLKPWSYFALYFASSPDLKIWTLEHPSNRVAANIFDPSQSIALDSAALYYYPTPMDRDPAVGAGGCKGVAFCSAIVDGGYLYVLLLFWSRLGPKSAMVRTKLDPTQTVGHNFDFELWDNWYSYWTPCREGRLPQWLNEEQWHGPIFGPPTYQIAPISTIPGKRFIAPHVGTFAQDGGPDYGLTVSFSDGLVSGWTDTERVIGSPDVVMHPSYFEDSTGGHFLFASGDPPWKYGDYYGLSIWQADVL